MNRRFLLAIAMIAVLATTAGCLAYVTGGGEVANETLDAEPPEAYVWDSSSDARIDLRSDATYLAVYNTSERDHLRLYSETGYGTEEPLEFRAFRYQYPNGTVINGSEFRARGGEVDRTPDEVWIRFGDEMEDGAVAFTSDGTARRFVARTYVTGSYELLLPEGYTIDFWLFGHASPRGYEVDTVDDRERITWESVTTSAVVVQAYRERDIPIFAAIVVIAVVIGTSGYLYFRRKLEALREQRQEMGLDLEEDAENERADDEGPPPGRR